MSGGRIKLIWDFHGPDAEKIAQHHVVHLKQFAETAQLQQIVSGIEIINEMHTIAFLVVRQEKMIEVRDALKPHRGKVFTE